MVDLPKNRAISDPHELSGGQNQRVMIATALAPDPGVIIADEPTTALEVAVRAQVLQVLTDLVSSRNLTLVMISRDLAVLAAVCERIVVMKDGRIVEDGPARQVVGAPQLEHTKALAAAFPVIGDPASRLKVGRVRGEGNAGDGDFSRSTVPKDVSASAGGPLIEVAAPTVDFRSRGENVRAVDHVSMSSAAGEIVEDGRVEDALLNPQHDYTRTLLSVVPSELDGW